MLDRRDGTILFVLTLFLFGLVHVAALGETPVDRTIITVYQNGPSLVVGREEVELDRGVNELVRVIPPSTLTETIFLDSPDGTVKNFRVVPPVNKESSLLERFVGEEIAVYKSGDDGAPVEETLVDLVSGSPHRSPRSISFFDVSPARSAAWHPRFPHTPSSLRLHLSSLLLC